jgi:putative SOS response-associated peptidase YedK
MHKFTVGQIVQFRPDRDQQASAVSGLYQVVDKPRFCEAFKHHRSIIPASGYYEWIKRPDGKQPYFISAADGDVLSVAGLRDRWKSPETGEFVASCTIIVTDANALTRPIHDRMPVVLRDDDPTLLGEVAA